VKDGLFAEEIVSQHHDGCQSVIGRLEEWSVVVTKVIETKQFRNDIVKMSNV